MLNYSPFYLKTHLPTFQSINMYWKKHRIILIKFYWLLFPPGLYFGMIFPLFSFVYFSYINIKLIILKQLCTLLSYKYKQKRVAVIASISDKLELKAK